MIKKFDVYITPLKLSRTIHLYLPNNYDYSDERYPVMYMYDGHNLYFDEDATFGKSWGLKEFLEHYDKNFIIVGIECNKDGRKRLDEFCPYTLPNSRLGSLNGQGKIFMDWVVNELKPYIDQNYRTIPFRECTGIGGSSMGGLMSLYTVIAYNQYFSKAACLSSSVSICMDELLEEFDTHEINPDTRVYLSHGKKETRGKEHLQQVKDNLEKFYYEFINSDAACMINITNGIHNEVSWEKENPTYFHFLWRQ